MKRLLTLTAAAAVMLSTSVFAGGIIEKFQLKSDGTLAPFGPVPSTTTMTSTTKVVLPTDKISLIKSADGKMVALLPLSLIPADKQKKLKTALAQVPACSISNVPEAVTKLSGFGTYFAIPQGCAKAALANKGAFVAIRDIGVGDHFKAISGVVAD